MLLSISAKSSRNSLLLVNLIPAPSRPLLMKIIPPFSRACLTLAAVDGDQCPGPSLSIRSTVDRLSPEASARSFCSQPSSAREAFISFEVFIVEFPLRQSVPSIFGKLTLCGTAHLVVFLHLYVGKATNNPPGSLTVPPSLLE